MAPRPSARTLRRRLVEELESKGIVTDPAVRRAFLAVPREHFLPSTDVAEVYANKAIVTRTDDRGVPTSSSSQPSIMALMLERLRLAPGLRVLEIGAGTGYNAALLSTLVGDAGSVTSVELEPDLAETAAAALASGGYRAEVVVGDGRGGWPAGAPYDRIVLTASTGTVPRALFDQLAPGGLVELPLHLDGPHLQVVVTLRREDGALRSVDAVEGGFMVLRDPSAPPEAPQGSSLSVSEHVDGRHRSFGSLAGHGLRRLRPAARRRLAGLLVESPSVRRLPGRSDAGRSPDLWLHLARPRQAVVARYLRSELHTGSHWAAAVASLDGRSLAVAVFGSRRGIRLESYGDARAGEVLSGLLDKWRDDGSPGTRDLDLRITYPAGGPRIRIGWNQPSTVSSRR